MRNIIKGIQQYQLLDRLELTALGLIDICFAIITTPHISERAIDRKIDALERARYQETIDEDDKRQVAAWLARLKHDGLIKKEGILWTITSEGKKVLNRLRRRVGLAAAYAEPVKSITIKIITFDIPEKMRGHRNWLRSALKNLDCIMLHKSVWLAKIELPVAFIAEIQRRRITQYVEIVGITKTGTIRREMERRR